VRLLALDISTNVGWALFASRRAKPRLDTWHAPPAMAGHHGRRLAMFEEWLRDKVVMLKPELVAFESPIFVKWSSDLATTEHTIRLLSAMAGMAEFVCHRAAVRCLEVHSQTAKRALAGNGRAKKDQMIAAAVKAGFDVANDHEADACAVALAAYEHIGERA
jgi:Holliday junction resolvasome RuvABC endonuclease subunit